MSLADPEKEGSFALSYDTPCPLPAPWPLDNLPKKPPPEPEPNTMRSSLTAEGIASIPIKTWLGLPPTVTTLNSIYAFPEFFDVVLPDVFHPDDAPPVTVLLPLDSVMSDPVAIGSKVTPLAAAAISPVALDCFMAEL